MKQVGAVGILVTMLTGLVAFLFKSVIANSNEITRLKVNSVHTKEMIIEIRSDIKELLKRP